MCGESWAISESSRLRGWYLWLLDLRNTNSWWSCYSRYKWFINLCKCSKQQPSTFSPSLSPGLPNKWITNPTTHATSKPSPKNPTIPANNAPFSPKCCETHRKSRILSCPKTSTSARSFCDPGSSNTLKMRLPPTWMSTLSSVTSPPNPTKSTTTNWSEVKWTTTMEKTTKTTSQ